MFQHTTFNSFEEGLITAYVNEFWSFLIAQIMANPLFDVEDKVAIKRKELELKHEFMLEYGEYMKQHFLK